MIAASSSRPVILVLAPMPAMPTSAGNRRRLLATCDFLKAAGFDIDFAYVAHEDQIYRRFNHHPPTDMEAMAAYFRRVYLIEIAEPVRLKTGAQRFGIDDWCPPEADAFVRTYFSESPGTSAILVNYVWLSRALEAAPSTCLKIIDTHDRFADRKAQYEPFRAEANFFHTDMIGEAQGLCRADLAIAIQPAEQAYFAAIMGRPAALLLPDFAEMRSFQAPRRLEAIGFLGHGNDANLLSIGRFAGLWSRQWQPSWPRLVIAGEVCQSLPADIGPGISLRGYVERIEDFYDAVDLVVAPILFGTGLKMKVLEAFSYGSPVVGTRQAFEGIETDVLEHQFYHLEGMLEHVVKISEDAAALKELCARSTKVFQQYRADARKAASLLASQLRHYDNSSLPKAISGLAIGSHIDVEETLASLPSISPGNEPLIATEFRPFSDAEPDTATPFRRRWYISATWAAEPSALDAIADRRVSLAPLVTSIPIEPKQRALSIRAIEALAFAAPDWRCTAELPNGAAEVVRMVFAGPSFLLKTMVPLRAFAVDATGCAHEIADVKIRRIARTDFTLRQQVKLTPRCGDTPVITLVLSGGWSDGCPKKEITMVIVVAHALLGHVGSTTVSIERELA